MNNQVSKRRAVGILAVFGAILILMASWNLGNSQEREASVD
jgi:hypothetical protein